MKKYGMIFGIALASALTAGSAVAGEPAITIFHDQYYYGGFMPQCISANGKYVCGSSFSQIGFIADWQEGDILICDGRDGHPFGSAFNYITNEGVALGAGLVNFQTGKNERLPFGGYLDMMTEDGRIVVGMTPKKEYSDFGSPHYVEYQACYWEDGEMHLLPVPTEEELGYYYLRTRARCVSNDGNVILGEIIDRLYQLPMVLWYRQPDGSYELDAVCKDYFSDIKYNEGYYKEYVTFQGCALSKNGKWVAMILREAPEYMKPANADLQLALYNVETGEIKKAIITEEFGAGYNPKYYIYYNGVADDGTIAGYYTNYFGGESAFIMYPDDMTPRNFIDVFNTIGPLVDYDEGGLNRVSSISPDGRFITGYGWRDDYEGYVLYTGAGDNEDNAVGAIGEEPAGEAEYYNLSGQRLPAPAKGVTIVRRPGGKTEKIIR